MVEVRSDGSTSTKKINRRQLLKSSGKDGSKQKVVYTVTRQLNVYCSVSSFVKYFNFLKST